MEVTFYRLIKFRDKNKFKCTTKLRSENLWKLRTAINNRPMRLQFIICHKKELLCLLFSVKLALIRNKCYQCKLVCTVTMNKWCKTVAARDKNVWWCCKCIAIPTSGGLRLPDPPHESYTNAVTLTTSHYNFNLPIGRKVSSITYARLTLCVISRVNERILIILEEINIRPADCLHQGTSCQLVKIH